MFLYYNILMSCCIVLESDKLYLFWLSFCFQMRIVLYICEKLKICYVYSKERKKHFRFYVAIVDHDRSKLKHFLCLKFSCTFFKSVSPCTFIRKF